MQIIKNNPEKDTLSISLTQLPSMSSTFSMSSLKTASLLTIYLINEDIEEKMYEGIW